jgi:hypothetical protein
MNVATMKVLPIVKMRAVPNENDLHHAIGSAG